MARDKIHARIVQLGHLPYVVTTVTGGELVCRTCCINRHLRHPLHRVKVCDIAYYVLRAVLIRLTGVDWQFLQADESTGFGFARTNWSSSGRVVSVFQEGAQRFCSRAHKRYPLRRRLLLWMQQGARAETTVTSRGVVAGDCDRPTNSCDVFCSRHLPLS